MGTTGEAEGSGASLGATGGAVTAAARATFAAEAAALRLCRRGVVSFTAAMGRCGVPTTTGLLFVDAFFTLLVVGGVLVRKMSRDLLVG